MAKVKNKKSNLADSYAKKRKEQQMRKKTLTPFEVHVNRDKQKVLGRKSKADRGLPGIARAKAISKRKNTLLLEYKVKDKDNIFLDRRIGEKNLGMTAEDKAMARFAAERIKAHNKKNIFNLNDDEVLTHRGQSLIDIEKYEDPRSDEEDYSDDENRTGKLDKKFVEDAHFGGGILSKPDSEMSRKDLIDQLIAESKKRKAERQKMREQTINLTEKLDSEWRDLLPLVTSSHKSSEKVDDKPQPDNYDKAVKELKFEARGNPTDKLKPEEEIANEEKYKLEKLEEERLVRMKGFSDEADFQKNHKSADDLDNFHIERIEESSDNKEDDQNNILINQVKEVQDEHNIDGDNEMANTKDFEEEEEEEEREVEDEESGEDNESEEESDNLFDLKVSDSSEEEEDQKKIGLEEQSVNSSTLQIQAKNNVAHTKIKSGEKNNRKTIRDNLMKDNENNESDVNIESKEAIIEKARQELPSMFKAPSTYEDLHSLVKNQSPDFQYVIIERIIKCNHWSLAERNKEKLLNLFGFLLQYLDEYASVNNVEELVKCFQIFDRLCPHLYDLTHANPAGTKTYLHDILKEKHNQFENNIKIYPKLNTLILFKLVSILYPTSDFRHPIVTPCLVFMTQILQKCKVKGRQDISKGLFVCTQILEYTLLSKRWSPEVINFLRGIIYISLEKPFSKPLKVIPPFKKVGEFSNILVLEENYQKSELDLINTRMKTEDFIEKKINDQFRIRTFVTAIRLLREFQEHCSKLEAAYSIFEPIFTLLQCGNVKQYPKTIRQEVKNLLCDIKKLKDKELEPLMADRKKPKALRMYEPRIEVVHDGKRHKPMSKTKAEREKLLHKLKKETKSAIREVRKDTAFLTKVKIKQQIASDMERKRKVKEILGDAAMQQSELKKWKKK